MKPITGRVDNIERPGLLSITESCRTPAVIRTLADLEWWFSTAEAGSTVIYHSGLLALDRGAGSRLGKEAGVELDRLANALMAMAEAGEVHLLQRRHGSCDYTYIVVAARGNDRRGPCGSTGRTA
jgi:hypothetical protein